MAGADYDYTKSLLPAGNGQLHAMSGGGHVQEGGANLSEATLKALFDFDVKESDVDNMILSSLTKKEEAVLNKEIILRLFKKFSSKDPLFNGLKVNPGTTFLLYKIEKSSSVKDTEYKITSYVLPVTPATDLKSITLNTTTPNQPSGNIVTSDKYLKLFFDNLFNLVDPSKSVNVLHLLVSFKAGSKPNIFIPVITKIEEAGKGKTVKLISQDIYDELDKIIKSESGPGPASASAGSTASPVPVAGSTASPGPVAGSTASPGPVAGSTASVGVGSTAGAGPAVPVVQAQRTITVLGISYILMMDVTPEDFTKLDEPGMEGLKKLHHDFGLDYIKDGREPANMKKATFINNLEKCQTTMTSLADEDCNTFRGIVTEVISNIVGSDIQPGSAPAGGSGAPAGGSGPIGSPAGGSGPIGSPAGGSGPIGSPAGGSGPIGSPAGGSGPMGSPAGGSGPMGSPAGGSGPIGSPAGGSGSMGSPAGSSGAPAGGSGPMGPPTYLDQAKIINDEIQKLIDTICPLNNGLVDTIKTIPTDKIKATLEEERVKIKDEINEFYTPKSAAKKDLKEYRAEYMTDAGGSNDTAAKGAVTELQKILDKLKGFETRIKALEAKVKANAPGGAGAGPVGSTVEKGIKQEANSCYFASALQYLNHIIPLRDAIIKTDFNKPDATKITEKFRKTMNKQEYINKHEKAKKDKADLETQFKQTFEDKPPTQKTKETLQKEYDDKKEELKTTVTNILSNPLFTSKPPTVTSDKLISKNIVRLLFIINKWISGKKRADISFLKSDFKTLPDKLEEIDTTKQEIMAPDSNGKILHDEYSRLISFYDEYKQLDITKNKALKLTDNTATAKENDTSHYINRIKELNKLITTWDKIVKNWDDKINPDNIITNAINALKSIITELNDNKEGAVSSKTGTINRFEEIMKFKPGEFGSCSQEDSASFLNEIAFGLLSCYNITLDILNTQLSTNTIIETICSDDNSITGRTEQPVLIKLISIGGGYNANTEKFEAQSSSIQEILNQKETSNPDDKDICRGLPEADAIMTNNTELLPTTKYVLINLNRSLSGVYNTIETKANYKLNINGKTVKLIGVIMKGGDASGGHYVYQRVKDDGKGNAIEDITFNDGTVIRDGYRGMNLNNNGILFLYEKDDPMTGGIRRSLGLRGKTMRTSRIAPEQSGGKRTLKARTSAPTSKPGPAQTKRRHLKERTTQSRTERSRVSGRLPIRRVGGK